MQLAYEHSEKVLESQGGLKHPNGSDLVHVQVGSQDKRFPGQAEIEILAYRRFHT